MTKYRKGQSQRTFLGAFFLLFKLASVQKMNAVSYSFSHLLRGNQGSQLVVLHLEVNLKCPSVNTPRQQTWHVRGVEQESVWWVSQRCSRSVVCDGSSLSFCLLKQRAPWEGGYNQLPVSLRLASWKTGRHPYVLTSCHMCACVYTCQPYGRMCPPSGQFAFNCRLNCRCPTFLNTCKQSTCDGKLEVNRE